MPIEYILLGVGIVLLGIEAVVPGFGFFGVTGLISLLAGSYYLLGGGFALLMHSHARMRPRIFCLVLYWHWAQ